MKRLIFSALVLSAVTANAQVKNGMVGINTDEPRATMHIEPGVSESKGLIIPRITAAQMVSMTSLAHFGADHHAIITYLKETLPVADRTGKLVDVAEPGYYYYDNTTGVKKWKTFGGGGEQDLRMVGSNHLTKDAGIGGNGTSLGSGGDNIAIGPGTFTGFANPAKLSGSGNIAMGKDIYYNNGGTMQAHGNTGIGRTLFWMPNGGTMQGGNNVALGSGIYHLSKANAQFTGINNFGIGQSLFHLSNGDITGGGNFAIGISHFNPSSGNVTGDFNFAIGFSQFNPGSGNVTGSNNFAIGNSSISANGDIGGQYNMGIGTLSISASNGNIGGSNNMGIGKQSISVTNGDLSGQNNLAFGNTAMNSNGNFTGSNNIAIGHNVLTGGSSGGIIGSYNVAIGSGAYYGLGEGSGNISIMVSNIVNTPALDGAIIIGNGSWGPLQDGTVAIGNGSYYNAPVLLGSSVSKVGVGGVTNPQAKLDVAGAVRVANDTSACTSTNEGSIRYVSATKKFQGCNGSTWVNLN